MWGRLTAVGLIKWFQSQWADTKRSGEWMADAPWPNGQPLSRWERWIFRTQPRSDMLFSIAIIATVVVVTIVLLVVVLVDALA